MEKEKTNGLINLMNLMADADLLADVSLPDMGSIPAGRYAISHVSDDGTRVALEDPADCELYVVSVTDFISAIMFTEQ